ncbi:Bax inhibitor 1-related protein [Corchorus olitorius]|uniref:Bax inhibitor 1-related protein n=1 Tax=Corchorus olitorius TaxID=93759 RepID=A0A1R3KDE6_9ROSI|nr:Bax inhibitor 1-related protein [Corchorus olitorius]
MLEPVEMRWAFIRKVYSIVAIQLLATIAVAATVVTVRPVAYFFVSSWAALCSLACYHRKHPVNYLLLGVYTVSLAFSVGLTCAFSFTSGKVILESVILTAVVVVALTLYTFWAASRGHSFNFLGAFLLGVILVLLVFSLIQIFFPLGRISVMIYGCLASIIFCGYIIYDTDDLIKRYSYDEYILAAISLYLDIINLFLRLLTVLRAANRN